MIEIAETLEIVIELSGFSENFVGEGLLVLDPRSIER